VSTYQGKKALLMAGGTGGHVFPALATAEHLEQQGVSIEWLGSSHGIENDLVPAAGIKLNTISVTGLRGKGKLSLLLAPFKVIRAVLQALNVLREVKPDVVLGMGGFASGPGGLAAWLLRVPVVVHEQNAISGMTNRILSRFATRVLEAFKGGFASLEGVVQTGNPVRGKILDLADPAERYADRTGPVRVLVVGGSLGAKAINDRLPEVLAEMPEDERPEVWHQTGKQHFETTSNAYQAAGIDVKVTPFIDGMDQAYQWADLVICRAGALTVSELAVAGVASVLVPFPFAVDDHQTANARYLEQSGAAVLLPQQEMTKEKLLSILRDLQDRTKLLQMASAARQQARPEASAEVAAICLEVMK